MDYSTISTRSLEKMLDRSAAGSAEQEAIQKELRVRGQGVLRPDRDTLLLFKKEMWSSTERR